MPEIRFFEVHKADAKLTCNRIEVNLFYPDMRDRIYREDRILSKTKDDVEFGIGVFQKLKYTECPIATPEYPLRPVSCGVADVMSNGTLITHRRDGNVPVRRFVHNISTGYPQGEEDYHDLKGLMVREGSEETVFVTNERRPWIVVPEEGDEKYDAIVEHNTLVSAERIGIDISRIRRVKVEFDNGPDLVNIHDGGSVIQVPCYIGLTWEQAHDTTAFRVRQWPLYIGDILPIDAEGDYSEGGAGHYGRESFVLDPKKLDNVKFGDRLPKASYDTYVFNRKTKKPELKHFEISPPFMPAETIERLLGALDVDCYKDNKWLDQEIRIHTERLLELGA